MANKKKTPKKPVRKRKAFTYEGHRYYVSGFTDKELKEAEQEKREQLKKESLQYGQDCIYDDFYEKWEKSRKDDRPSTIARHRYLHNAISKVKISNNLRFGELHVKEITVDNMRSLQEILKSSNCSRGSDKTYSTNTVNQMITLVKTVLAEAVNVHHIMVFNPAAGVKPLKRTEPKARDTIHNALSIEQTQLFLDTAKELKSWYYNLYVFLLNTGLRIGEAGALLPKDIEGDVIHITKTLTKDECGAVIIGDEPKTDTSKRDMYLTEEAIKAISDQKEQNAKYLDMNVIRMDYPIFRAEYGGLICGSPVRADMERICKKAGIPRITPHAWRATNATRQAEQGVQNEILRDNMGHSDIGLTMNLYAHTDARRRKEQSLAVKYV